MAASAVADLAREIAEERGAPRRQLRLALASEQIAGATVLRNISRTGVMIECPTALVVGERVDITFPELGSRTLTVQRSEGNIYGCRFDAPITSAAISAALLRAEPLQGNDAQSSRTLYNDDVVVETYPLHVRMRIFLGLSLLSWGVVLGAAAAFW